MITNTRKIWSRNDFVVKLVITSF